MSWLGFFSLGSAWLALLLVPLVLVYFLKLRRARQRISSLALWYQVINDQRVNSPFQKFSRRYVNEICEGLVPALQRCGVVRTEYTKSTLRKMLREF